MNERNGYPCDQQQSSFKSSNHMPTLSIDEEQKCMKKEGNEF